MAWRPAVPTNITNPTNPDPNFPHGYGYAATGPNFASHSMGSYRPSHVSSSSAHASSLTHTSYRDNPQLNRTINTTYPGGSNHSSNHSSNPSHPAAAKNHSSSLTINVSNTRNAAASSAAAAAPPADSSSHQQRRLQMIERWLQEERQSILEAEEAEAELVFALDRAHFNAEQAGLPSSCFEDAMSEAEPFKALRGTEYGDATLRAELLGKRQHAALTLARLRCLQCLTAIATTGHPGEAASSSLSPSRQQSHNSNNAGSHFPSAEAALSASLHGSLRSALQPLLPLLKPLAGGGAAGSAAGGAAGGGSGPGSAAGMGVSSAIAAAGGTASSVAGLERQDATSTTASESKFLLGSKTCRSETSSSITETSAAQRGGGGGGGGGGVGGGEASRDKEIQQLRSALAEAYEHIAELQSRVGGD